MFVVEVFYLDGRKESFNVDSGRYKIGRSKKCDIVLADSALNRSHAVLDVDFPIATLTPIRSALILLNEERVNEPTNVANGTAWTIGETSIRVLSPNKVQPEAELPDTDTMTTKEMPQSAVIDSKRVEQEENSQPAVQFDETLIKLKGSIHNKVLEHLELYRRGSIHTMSNDELRKEAMSAAEHVIEKEKISIPSHLNRQQLIDEVVAEAIGLGPIEPLLADESVTEIMVNGPRQIYVERSGQLGQDDICYTNDAALMSAIERIVTPIGRRIDEGSPMVDARLSDGSRVNAIIPPLSLIGPVLTIRKFSKRKFTIDDLVKFGTVSPEMAEFLGNCVKYKKNILVSGGTGSGKTTTLNILSNFIPEGDRIVTIEDAAELQLHQNHVISLESRPPNVEGVGEVSIRDLVKNSLRMRPDRIVVGECRGGEALDMLQAMNTGHDGSLSTGHANTPRDLLARLEVMVLMSGIDLPVRAIREQIASAVDIIVQQTRSADGRRRITSVVEIDGMEGDVILLQKLFEFKQEGLDENGGVIGSFVGCGQIPVFYSDLQRAGIKLDFSIFGDLKDIPPEEKNMW